MKKGIIVFCILVLNVFFLLGEENKEETLNEVENPLDLCLLGFKNEEEVNCALDYCRLVFCFANEVNALLFLNNRIIGRSIIYYSCEVESEAYFHYDADELKKTLECLEILIFFRGRGMGIWGYPDKQMLIYGEVNNEKD